MAKIVWANKASDSLDKNIEFCEENFGRKATNRIYNLVFKKIIQLEKFPLTGFPEPLLSERKEYFRSCIIQSPIKMVYHYDEESDTVFIDNFWDMRKNPNSLKKEI